MKRKCKTCGKEVEMGWYFGAFHLLKHKRERLKALKVISMRMGAIPLILIMFVIMGFLYGITLIPWFIHEKIKEQLETVF
jgi:hypothetical protein